MLKLFALALFLCTYILMISLPKYRPWVALGSAALFLLSGIVPLGEAFGAVDWNVLMMLTGTMGTVSLFIDSKMPNRLAEAILSVTPNVMWVVVAMSLFAGIVSAFIDNVATVLMIAPVGLAIAKKLNISPVPMIISIAVSSNLQGAATLVGDTTSIMLGGYADMDFLDFFFMNGRPSIFWAVELGALATIPVILATFAASTGAPASSGSSFSSCSAACWARYKTCPSAARSAIFSCGSPCCRIPKKSPGPRVRRSYSATLKPSPVPVIYRSRSRAASPLASERRMQQDGTLPRPTRPRSWCS